MKKPPLYGEPAKRDLRALLVSNGVSSTRAEIVVDIACRAVEQAYASLEIVLKSAPDFGVGMMATEIALQLAADHFATQSKALSAVAARMNLPQREGAVNMGGRRNG